MQRKVVKLLATLGLAAAVFVSSAPSAEAALQLRLTQGASQVTVTDDAAGDLLLSPGTLLWAGNIGTFTINIESGISTSPAGDPLLQLTSSNRGTGDLRIELTDTNYILGSALNFDVNGTSLFGNVVAKAFYGTAAFEQGTQIGSTVTAGPGSGSMSFGGITAGGGPSAIGSLTIVIDITGSTLGAFPAATTFDASITSPEPATMGLFGLALFGLGGAVRRRFNI